MLARRALPKPSKGRDELAACSGSNRRLLLLSGCTCVAILYCMCHSLFSQLGHTIEIPSVRRCGSPRPCCRVRLISSTASSPVPSDAVHSNRRDWFNERSRSVSRIAVSCWSFFAGSSSRLRGKISLALRCRSTAQLTSSFMADPPADFMSWSEFPRWTTLCIPLFPMLCKPQRPRHVPSARSADSKHEKEWILHPLHQSSCSQHRGLDLSNES